MVLVEMGRRVGYHPGKRCKNGLAFSTAGTGTVRLLSDKDGRCGEDASVLKEIDHIYHSVYPDISKV